jgi:hypothetical protein
MSATNPGAYDHNDDGRGGGSNNGGGREQEEQQRMEKGKGRVPAERQEDNNNKTPGRAVAQRELQV